LLSWLPRLNYYDLTYLLVGLSAGDASRPIEKAQ
jgi:hypothetical protein